VTCTFLLENSGWGIYVKCCLKEQKHGILPCIHILKFPKKHALIYIFFFTKIGFSKICIAAYLLK